MKIRTVLSLFDGISCGRVALDRAGIEYDNYYASEIDKFAIQVAQKNHPDTIQLGDVTNWRRWNIDFRKVDLILAGSPCQGFSFAGDQEEFDDPRSALYFQFEAIVRWVRMYNPDVKFLLENTYMSKKAEAVITRRLGVEPVKINSRLLSAQNRPRIYWANWDITQPEDKGILLKDVVFPDALFSDPDYAVAMHNLYGGWGETENRTSTEKSPCLRTPAGGGHIPSLLHSEKALAYMDRQVADGRNHWDFAHHSDVRKDKSATVVAVFYKGVPYNVLKTEKLVRKFHPVECERLQTLPDNYTAGVSNTQRYKGIGNGWTVDVIVHILKGLEA